MSDEVREAIEALVEADEEIIENMDGIRQDLAKDVRDLVNGDKEDYRVLDKLDNSGRSGNNSAPNFCPECGHDLRSYTHKEKSRDGVENHQFDSELKESIETIISADQEIVDNLDEGLVKEEIIKVRKMAEEVDNSDANDEKSQEITESEKELKELLKENPDLYDTLSPLEQRVIDELGLKPNS